MHYSHLVHIPDNVRVVKDRGCIGVDVSGGSTVGGGVKGYTHNTHFITHTLVHSSTLMWQSYLSSRAGLWGTTNSSPTPLQ